MSLIGTYKNYKYYKVPVKGTMNDQNILSACNSIGMKPPCVNEQNGVLSDGTCRDVGFRDGTKPLKELANTFCTSSKYENNVIVDLLPHECRKTSELFAYMGGKNNGKSCDVSKPDCNYGNISNRQTICVRSDLDTPTINNLKWIGTTNSDTENPANNQIFIYQLADYKGWRITLFEGSFMYPLDEYNEAVLKIYSERYFQLLDENRWTFPLNSMKVGSNMFVLFSETDDLSGNTAFASYQPGYRGALGVILPQYIITKNVGSTCNTRECCKRINLVKRAEKTSDIKYTSTKNFYECAGCPIVEAPNVIPNCELNYVCYDEPCLSCCSEQRCKSIDDMKKSLNEIFIIESEKKRILTEELNNASNIINKKKLEISQKLVRINNELRQKSDEHQMLIQKKIREKNQIIDQYAFDIQNMNNNFAKQKKFTIDSLEDTKIIDADNLDYRYLKLELDTKNRIKNIDTAYDELDSIEKADTKKIIDESNADLQKGRVLMEEELVVRERETYKGFLKMNMYQQKESARLTTEHEAAMNKLKKK